MKEIVVGPDVDPMILARGTPGFSGADLQNMVKYALPISPPFFSAVIDGLSISQAAIQASKELCKAVELKHLEWAKVCVVATSHSSFELRFLLTGSYRHGSGTTELLHRRESQAPHSLS